MKRMLTRIASMSLIAVMCVPHNASVYADDIREYPDYVADTPYAEVANGDLYYNGAPVIFTQSDDELPQSMRDNIATCLEKDYRSPKNEKSYNDFLFKSASWSKDSLDRATVYPTLSGLFQYPQERGYYCGYAAMQSVLKYHGINKTQQEIAGEAYNKNDSLAWFAGSQSQAEDWNYYPAAVYLNTLLDHDFRPYNAYFGTYTESELSQKLRYNISEAREPVLIAGISKGNDSNGSKLPGYPNEDIGHWIVAYRVAWDTEAQSVSRVHYRDPAKSDAVSWSGSISATADTDLTRMYKFSLGLGIIS